MKRRLKGALVVITGASSGIGRASALAFARQGAQLVLAARDAQALEEVADICRQYGGKATPNVTDVTNPASVTFLAEYAAELGHGRIDVWVNNAGVGAVGAFLETPLEAHEQVIRTNLLGYLYGAYAVMPYFLQQRQGILINNISVGAWFPVPYAVAYSASKFGLEGFSQALRGEMSRWPDIHICDLYPSFVNTPGLTEHAGNYTHSDLPEPSLAMEPQAVADAIVSLARSPRDRMRVGASTLAAQAAHSFSPRLSGLLAARVMELIRRKTRSREATSGALFQPKASAKTPSTKTLGTTTRPRRRLRWSAVALAIGATCMFAQYARHSHRAERRQHYAHNARLSG